MLVFAGLTPQQLSFFTILVVAFVLLLTERLRNDLVALLIILALAISHVLPPDEALAGFSSEPAIVVAAIFVLSNALERTGLSDTIGGWIGHWAGHGYTRVIAVFMPTVALLSAFTHHLTTTAIMLPITLKLARERDIPPSKLLMPLAMAASLGTTITIIGAPAFLIADGIPATIQPPRARHLLHRADWPQPFAGRCALYTDWRSVSLTGPSERG
jgi:di/tricarboxylate transporter